jgi:hypothetical protein
MTNKTVLEQLEDLILFRKTNPLSKRDILLEIRLLKAEEKRDLCNAYVDGMAEQLKAIENQSSMQEPEDWFKQTYPDN